MKLDDVICLAVGCMLLAAVSGCNRSSAAVDSADAGMDGSRFLLLEEPADVMCVCDVRDMLPRDMLPGDALPGDALPGDAPIAVVGRIGGIEHPWTEGEASFIMSDPSLLVLPPDEHDCGENCPYCAKKKNDQLNAMAFVQLVDDDGRVVRTDARTLLDVAEGQMIVVQGRASLNRTGHLVIAATGLYVRE